MSDAVAARRSRHLLSFHDFVEEALFNRRWGYYAAGGVRFGDGGDFDTYPLALSPYFGLMVASRARRLWRELGRPRRFEICEIGAGNGQLCLDVLAAVDTRGGRDPDWRRFGRALTYRIVEKSAALRRRQRALLGPLAGRVEWEPIDLSRARPPRERGRCGFVIGNEVLDCLAHHKVVLGRDRRFRAVWLRGRAKGRNGPLSRAGLNRALGRGDAVRFEEVRLPVAGVRGLGEFLERHYPDIQRRRAREDLPWTYYACPAFEKLIANLGRLYARSEIVLVDYGGDRDYHLYTPARSRIAAGRPEEHRATPYRAPGRDDITFLVDFSVAMNAARDAGLEVFLYGPQGNLASLSGVRLTPTAMSRIVEHRALRWLLALSGVGPEQRQKAAALSWTPRRGGPTKTLEEEAREAVDDFLGRRPSTFQVLVLRKGLSRPAASADRARAYASRAGRRSGLGPGSPPWRR